MNISVKISINSGTALFVYLGAFFGLVLLAAHNPAIERLFAVALGGLTGAFAGFLIKRNSNNRIDLEAAKLKVVPEEAK